MNYHGGTVLPLPLPPSLPYTVNSLLPTQPTVRTAPIDTDGVLAAGSVFSLGFAYPDAQTLALLTSGTVVLRFALADGVIVQGAVQITSAYTSGENFLNVYCTIPANILIIQNIVVVESSSNMGTTQLVDQYNNPLGISGNPLKVDGSTVTQPVTLSTLIAGEDLTNNRLMVSSEVALSNTNTHNAVSVLNGSNGTTTNANYSSPVNSADYRTILIAGWGSAGTIQLLLQVSFDGGSTWLWSGYGFTTASQFALQQNILFPVPLCRVAVVNVSGSTQNITAYLTLGR